MGCSAQQLQKLSAPADLNGDGFPDRLTFDSQTQQPRIAFGKKGGFYPEIHRLTRADLKKFKDLTVSGFKISQIFSGKPIKLPEELDFLQLDDTAPLLDFRGVQELRLEVRSAPGDPDVCTLGVSLRGIPSVN